MHRAYSFSRFTMVFAATLILTSFDGAAFGQKMREAAPMPIGKTMHFTMDKDEQKDLATSFARGTYYILVDCRRGDGETSNIQVHMQLLKSNGAMVEDNFVRVNEIGVTSRSARRYTFSKPLASRLRLHASQGPMLVWLTILPVAKWTSVPFPSGKNELKPLGIGPNEGKGGSLDLNDWAYHAISLPPGRWTVSLYGKRPDGKRSNIQGVIERLDEFGLSPSEDWKLRLNEIGLEARKEKLLILTKPGKVIFKVTTASQPLDYTIGIEKATE